MSASQTKQLFNLNKINDYNFFYTFYTNHSLWQGCLRLYALRVGGNSKPWRKQLLSKPVQMILTDWLNTCF